ncbi:hypothetical protein AMATHDRAFT_87710 [Amanita thiersii Skay4041]|uniref:F-box domain-containing protein n=1 Tax=Amanita thiersii Skay4041 TaxID=703135 RepID=A0A2A9NI75_9AGAR|nr:hypothetical protein AMATHDRAFT_87710 [Amanita thiersii Skay4041]
MPIPIATSTGPLPSSPYKSSRNPITTSTSTAALSPALIVAAVVLHKATGVHTLPPELWEHVFKRIPRPHDLLHVILTCRAFYQIGVKALYSNIIYRHQAHFRSNRPFWSTVHYKKQLKDGRLTTTSPTQATAALTAGMDLAMFYSIPRTIVVSVPYICPANARYDTLSLMPMLQNEGNNPNNLPPGFPALIGGGGGQQQHHHQPQHQHQQPHTQPQHQQPSTNPPAHPPPPPPMAHLLAPIFASQGGFFNAHTHLPLNFLSAGDPLRPPPWMYRMMHAQIKHFSNLTELCFYNAHLPRQMYNTIKAFPALTTLLFYDCILPSPFPGEPEFDGLASLPSAPITRLALWNVKGEFEQMPIPNQAAGVAYALRLCAIPTLQEVHVDWNPVTAKYLKSLTMAAAGTKRAEEMLEEEVDDEEGEEEEEEEEQQQQQQPEEDEDAEEETDEDSEFDDSEDDEFGAGNHFSGNHNNNHNHHHNNATRASRRLTFPPVDRLVLRMPPTLAWPPDIGTSRRTILDPLNTFLNNVPSVSTLSIINRLPLCTIPPSALPRLETYSGPLSSIINVATGRNLQHLEIRDEDRKVMDVISMLPALRDVAPGLKTLCLPLRKWDDEVLYPTSEFFPELRKLKITYDDGVPSEYTILSLGARFLYRLVHLETFQLYNPHPPKRVCFNTHGNTNNYYNNNNNKTANANVHVNMHTQHSSTSLTHTRTQSAPPITISTAAGNRVVPLDAHRRPTGLSNLSTTTTNTNASNNANHNRTPPALLSPSTASASAATAAGAGGNVTVFDELTFVPSEVVIVSHRLGREGVGVKSVVGGEACVEREVAASGGGTGGWGSWAGGMGASGAAGGVRRHPRWADRGDSKNESLDNNATYRRHPHPHPNTHSNTDNNGTNNTREPPPPRDCACAVRLLGPGAGTEQEVSELLAAWKKHCKSLSRVQFVKWYLWRRDWVSGGREPGWQGWVRREIESGGREGVQSQVGFLD